MLKSPRIVPDVTGFLGAGRTAAATFVIQVSVTSGAGYYAIFNGKDTKKVMNM